MNQEIESSLRSWLSSLEDFDGVSIHAGQDNTEIPGDQPAIITACGEIEAVGGNLHKASVTLLLSTPCNLESDQHRTLALALRDAVFAPSALATFFPTSLSLAGISLRTWQESQDGGRWICTANLTLGIARNLTT
jgi:hypothetical protein